MVGKKETIIRLIGGDDNSEIKIVGTFEIVLEGGTLRINPYNRCEDFEVTTNLDKAPVVTEQGGNYLRVKIEPKKNK